MIVLRIVSRFTRASAASRQGRLGHRFGLNTCSDTTGIALKSEIMQK
jgi:hypothetical protein